MPNLGLLNVEPFDEISKRRKKLFLCFSQFYITLLCTPISIKILALSDQTLLEFVERNQ